MGVKATHTYVGSSHTENVGVSHITYKEFAKKKKVVLFLFNGIRQIFWGNIFSKLRILCKNIMAHWKKRLRYGAGKCFQWATKKTLCSVKQCNIWWIKKKTLHFKNFLSLYVLPFLCLRNNADLLAKQLQLPECKLKVHLNHPPASC